MRKRIRELGLETIVDGVRRATDVARGRACHPLIQEELDQARELGQRLESLRNHIGSAAVQRVTAPEDLQLDQPLVEAFVRTQRHPSAPVSLPPFALPGGVPAKHRFAALLEEHRHLEWDTHIVRALLWRAVQAHGEHELDDTKPPWLMYWGPSSAAAYALIIFVTYDCFGSLGGTDPNADVARRALEQQALELAHQLSDAMVRHDDPDVRARREAYEQEKDRRIGASLGSFYVKTGQREGNEPLDRAIAKMLRYLADRIEAEAPATGAAILDQPLPTLDDGSLVWLELLALSSTRELVLRIRTPDGKRTVSWSLRSESTSRIIAFLQAASAPEVILAAIDELRRAI